VTLFAQLDGSAKITEIGTVQVHGDGTWTIPIQDPLANGTYAIYATQSGDTGAPTTLYSLTPDYAGKLSNALIIQAPIKQAVAARATSG
jgi:hypothetical protein